MAQATDIVTYRCILFDTTNQPVRSLAVSLQYFKGSTRTWEEIHSGVIKEGLYSFTETLNREAYSVFIRESIIPEIRIVAVDPVYGFKKPEVLALIYQFSVTTTVVNGVTVTNFLIDFGTNYLVEKETVATADVFSDFIVITSFISLVNQEQLKKQIDALKRDLQSCQATNTKLLADNRAQADEIGALKIQIQAKDATIASLNTQLIAALSQVEQKTLEVTRLNSIKQELEKTILALQKQIEELSREINFDERPIPVNTLYTNLIREIDVSTQNNLDAGFKLANISLKLKTVLSSDENGINAQLFGLSTMDQLNGAAISELVFDIAPSTTPAPQTGTMPDLLGLTETAVRKILVSLGLRLNPVFQNNQQVVNGDSFRQSPAAGATFNTNDFVTVIFSKHE
jgi:hypothetical protein